MVIQVTELADVGISSAPSAARLDYVEKEVYAFVNAEVLSHSHGVTMELPYDIKRRRNTDEKNHIAIAALEFVENGDTILLDAGSTTYALAQLLHSRERITVVTNDLNIAMKLASIPSINLICTGGIARQNVYTLEGSQVTDFIRNLRVDKSFIGADAIHPDGVIANVNIEKFQLNRP